MLASSAACLALVALTAWFLEWPFEKAALLAPVIVVAVGAAVGLVVLWLRVGLESLRGAGRPRLVLGLALGVIALVALLTALGVTLPRE